MSQELRQVYVIGDKEFTTKAEALTFLRRPKIEAEMVKVTGGNKDLTTWLLDNQESVEVAFEVGTIRRVTKSEHNKLTKAVEAMKAIEGNPKIAFLQENAGAILDSFRWPAVKRMDEAEKNAAARNSLVAASEGNEELAEWIVSNKDAVLAAYDAGKEKREVSTKATEGLAAYRAKKAAEKAEAEALEMAEAEKKGPEAVAALIQKREAAAAKNAK